MGPLFAIAYIDSIDSKTNPNLFMPANGVELIASRPADLSAGYLQLSLQYFMNTQPPTNDNARGTFRLPVPNRTHGSFAIYFYGADHSGNFSDRLTAEIDITR